MGGDTFGLENTMEARHAILWGIGIIVIISGRLCAGTYSGGLGTAEDPYQIGTVADWQELIAVPSDWDKHFILLNDIDFGGMNLKPVGSFSGVFDGNGHVLRNAVINLPGSDYVGLFGHIGTGGQILHLGVKNVNAVGQNYIGGLCGDNFGTILGCYATGSINSVDFVGGLCGVNYDTISDCSFTGSVRGSIEVGGLVGYHYSGAISGCYFIGTVTGDLGIGGLVGQTILGTISGCYASGTARSYDEIVGGLCGWNESGTISDCYATGAVSGTGSCVGGLVGCNSIADTVNGCFWDIQTSGLTTSAGGTGKTTAEMKTPSTFTVAGWDFEHTWWMPAEDYPRLLCQGQGFLQVMVLPAEAAAEGAQWRRVGTTDWLDRGQIEKVLALPWDVEFKSTTHWRRPGPIHVSIFPNDLTQIEATYIAPGSLQVTILPAEAIAEGAHWRRVGTTEWLDSGQIETVLAIPWDVEFKPTTHWRRTEPIQVSISPNELTQIQATYSTSYSGGLGTAEDPYQIGTVADLNAAGLESSDWDKHFILIADLDCQGWEISPLGTGETPFSGEFNGRGHNITHVTQAPFYRVDTSGRIRDLHICSIDVTEWEATVSGLVRYNFGTLANCSVDVSGNFAFCKMFGGLVIWNYGTLENCSVLGVMAVSQTMGGLVAWNYGTLRKCTSTVSFYTPYSPFYGAMNGGLVGINYGTLTHCSVDGTGDDPPGGLVGENYGTLIHCSLEGGMSSFETAGGLVMSNYGSLYQCRAVGGFGFWNGGGGLVAINRGLIRDSYVQGSFGIEGVEGALVYINGGQVINCYAAGRMGRPLVGYSGDLVAKTETVCQTKVICEIIEEGERCWEVEECIPLGEVISSFSDLCIEEDCYTHPHPNIEAMQKRATYISAGWDFVGESGNGTEDIWRLCADGVNYPRLAWEFSDDGDFNCPDGVRWNDLVYLSGRWLATKPKGIGAADGNADHRVDMADLALLAENWMK